MGGALAVGSASLGGKVAWIVPVYKNGRSLWRWAESTVAPLKKTGTASVNRSERTIDFSNGGFLGVYSADNEDAIRGESFDLVILDEAARISETAWTDAIQPTLADRNGDAILISTPKGRNWFWLEFQKGLADGREQAAFTAPTSDNPNPNIRRAAEKARDKSTERTYRQEWLAEFVEDGGGVIRRVLEATTATAQEGAVTWIENGRNWQHTYVVGVDWAKQNDFTVLTVLDTDTREVVALDRFNQIDYSVQVGRLRALSERFHPSVIIAERNSIGEPLIEQLTREGLPVQAFTTTQASKAQAIDALALAFERGDIRILPDATLIAELQAYEAERLPSGMLRYSAPEGMHDDCVMSLALAWQGIGKEVTAVRDPFSDW